MLNITSINNPKVQFVKKLVKSKSFRYENRLFVAEGYNIVKDIPDHLIDELYITSEAILKYKDIIKKSSNIIECSEKVMSSMADTVTPSGVLAVCKMLDVEKKEYDKAILVDNLNDPGNMGTIIRTAVACEVECIYLYGNTVDVYSPKVVRSSMGGVFHITPIEVDISDLDNLIVLDMKGENIFDLSNSYDKFTLVVGNEAHGVSSPLREKAMKTISLPMSDKMESLNAGVSISIALYQLIYGGKK